MFFLQFQQKACTEACAKTFMEKNMDIFFRYVGMNYEVIISFWSYLTTMSVCMGHHIPNWIWLILYLFGYKTARVFLSLKWPQIFKLMLRNSAFKFFPFLNNPNNPFCNCSGRENLYLTTKEMWFTCSWERCGLFS